MTTESEGETHFQTGSGGTGSQGPCEGCAKRELGGLQLLQHR